MISSFFKSSLVLPGTFSLSFRRVNLVVQQILVAGAKII